MKIICITGMPLAGKTLAANFVKEKMNINVISMGDKIRKIANKKGIKTKKGIENLIIEIRNKYGKDIAARECEEDIKKVKNSVVIIEGIRNLDEVEYFKKFGNVYIIAIHSSIKKRYERALKRKRLDDPKDFKEFKERDKREIFLGIDNVISLADYIIINEGSIENLKRNIINVIKKILNNDRN